MPPPPTDRYASRSAGAYQQWCPPALTDAAGPLDTVASLLHALSEDHQGLSVLCDGSPSVDVHRAVEHFLEVYGDAVFRLSGTARGLAFALRMAAQSYQVAEQALVAATRPEHGAS